MTGSTRSRVAAVAVATAVAALERAERLASAPAHA